CLRSRAVQTAGSIATLANEPCLFEYRQVLRDRWTSDVKVRGDLAGRELIVTDEYQNVTPARLSDRFQSGIHALTVRHRLRKCQVTLVQCKTAAEACSCGRAARRHRARPREAACEGGFARVTERGGHG